MEISTQNKTLFYIVKPIKPAVHTSAYAYDSVTPVFACVYAYDYDWLRQSLHASLRSA